MAWNKVTAEELKELGLDPEVFKKLAEKNTALETQLVDMKKSQDDTFNGIKNSITAMENSLKSFKPAAATGGNGGNTGGNAGGSGGNNSGGEGSGDAGDKAEELDFLMEPEKSTRSVVNKAVTPLLAATAEMRADMIYNRFANQNLKGFRKFEKEIKELWDKQNVVSRQNPELLENCYKIVIANHVDEIQKGGESFFIESGSASNLPGTMADGTKKKAVDVLNKDQLEQCQKWGIDPEEYLKELQTTYA